MQERNVIIYLEAFGALTLIIFIPTDRNLTALSCIPLDGAGFMEIVALVATVEMLLAPMDVVLAVEFMLAVDVVLAVDVLLAVDVVLAVEIVALGIVAFQVFMLLDDYS